MRIKQTDEEKQILKMIGRNIKFYRINHNCSSKDTDEYGRITQEKLAELAMSDIINIFPKLEVVKKDIIKILNIKYNLTIINEDPLIIDKWK